MRFNSNVKFLFKKQRKNLYHIALFKLLTTLHGLKTRISSFDLKIAH